MNAVNCVDRVYEFYRDYCLLVTGDDDLRMLLGWSSLAYRLPVEEGRQPFL